MKRYSGLLGSVLLLAAALGCSGGGSSTGAGASLTGECGDPGGLCLSACNLGYSASGCSVTDIAVNQQLIFQFNKELDPTSVGHDTISIRTAQGATPTGTFVVQGATAFFVPEIREVGTQTFFGFEKGSAYTIFLPAGPKASRTLRSTGGAPLITPMTCTVVATYDVIDLDGQAPQVSLVVPAMQAEVPTDTAIVLEFSEYVIPSTAISPEAVKVVVYQKDPATGLVVPVRREVQVDQLRNWAQLTLFPEVVLPGDINVMVGVDAVVRDLSGKTLKPTSFFFRTTGVAITPEAIAEDFATSAMVDRDRSGAVWGGGELKPGLLGGSGILGDFRPEVGSTKVGDTYVFNTDNTVITGEFTLDGRQHQVTDGRFEFGSFFLPQGTKVRFEGSHPARIYVRGSVEIQGLLDLSGQTSLSTANYNTNPNERGAAGGKAGAGGGAGGMGGNEPGQGVAQGQNGVDVPVPAGHPRKGQETGTGGRGSKEHPLGLTISQIVLDYYDIASIQLSAPGGGGGNYLAGGLGGIAMVSPPNWSMKVPAPQPVHGAAVSASGTFPFLPILGAPQVIEQVVLGGSGGGGVGTCAWGTWSVAPGQVTWSFGNGGGGGGGGLAIRCGGDMRFLSSGIIQASGGVGGGAGKNSGLAPGGGGSGGTVLLQVAGAPILQGEVDLRGGAALKSMDLYSTTNITSASGGAGYLRVEAIPAPAVSGVGRVYPTPSADNVGLLTDRDPVSGAVSRWYSTKRLFPRFKHYEIEALVGTQPVLFTDDPTRSNPTILGTTPVVLFLQGAQLDDKQQLVELSISRWVASTEDLVDANKNGGVGVPQVFRWTILLDQSKAGGQELKVTRMALVVSD